MCYRRIQAVIAISILRQIHWAQAQVDYDGEEGWRRLDPPPADADMDPDYMPLSNRTTQVAPAHQLRCITCRLLTVCLGRPLFVGVGQPGVGAAPDLAGRLWLLPWSPILDCGPRTCLAAPLTLLSLVWCSRPGFCVWPR